jgi:dipeptidyl aminopeptidase/acylaminoacyl peptidase
LGKTVSTDGRSFASARGTTRVLASLVPIVALLVLAAPTLAASPGDNGKIVFVSNRDGNSEIYTMNADGSAQTRLTNTAEQETSPAWSPNGQKIAYAKSYPRGQLQVWVMNADGSGQTFLTYGFNGGSTWSPDGRQIAVENYETIDVVNADGSGQPEMFAGPSAGDTYDIDWSPNAPVIVYSALAPLDPELGTISLEDRQSHKITFGAYDIEPDWSPDGSKIAYSVYDGVAMVNPDGTGGSQVMTVPDAECCVSSGFPPAWSPDGTKIAFARSGGIWKMNADGSGQTRITSSGDGDPDWQALKPPGYSRPKAASPSNYRLVPAYKPCTSTTGNHGAPLVAPSCTPGLASDFLTIGTPDANGKAAASTGFVKLKVLTEAPIDLTNGDQSDVEITAQITDVRNKQSLTDYTGELRAAFALRLTDTLNGAGLVHPATVADTSFGFTFACTPTAGEIGSSCSTATTADAVVPGITPEKTRAVWQLGPLQVYDGGADADADTPGDNTLFATQGLFAP